MSYKERTIETTLERAASEFPAVVLTGPRQSGKTTTLKHLFGQTHRYVSVEPPDIRLSAVSDPRTFLELHKPPVIIDEVQHAPELLAYIKEKIDARRNKTGQFILSGSQNLMLLAQVGESLAGRTAVLKLLPLSLKELRGVKDEPLFNGIASTKPAKEPSTQAFDRLTNLILRGFYPEIAGQGDRDFRLWHSSYLQTYIERDVRTLRQIGNLALFQTFLQALASRNGQLLNLTDLSRDIGVALNTAKAWLSALEASYQIAVIRPYFRNLGKRLVKAPKVYFTDTGVLCNLVGISDAEHLSKGPMAGSFFETVVLMELLKYSAHTGRPHSVYFWRTSNGEEIDFVFESNGDIYAIEAKLNSTPNPAMAKGITKLIKAAGISIEENGVTTAKSVKGFVVHPGNVTAPLGNGVMAIPVGRM